MDAAIASLPEIRSLGCRFLEMEGLGRGHLAEMYKGRREVRRVLDHCGLHVHNFCVVDPDLVSVDAAVRRAALDCFECLNRRHCTELRSPGGVFAETAIPVSGRQCLYVRGRDPPTPARGFEWACIWDALVESVRFCADVAAKYERIVLMEPRVGEVICSVDSLMRLIEQ